MPYAHSIYHVRNRTYAPQLGRFMQPDPNAAGQSLLDGASFNGRGMGAIAIAFDLEGRYGDGMNLYEYLGSSPWRRFDGMGLSWDPFEIVDEYVAEDFAQRASFGATLWSMVKVGFNVVLDIASLHPVANIVISVGRLASGEYSLEEVIFDAARNYAIGKVLSYTVQAFAKLWRTRKSAKALSSVASYYEHVGKTGTYSQMKAYTAGYNHAIEAHHLVEVRHIDRLGLGNANAAPAVILTKAEHDAITRELYNLLPRGQTYTRQQILAAYRQVYSGRPEWIVAVEQYLR